MFSCYHPTAKARAKAVEEKYKGSFRNADYVSVGPTQSTLDGEYTAKQLRTIADAMDELKRVK